MQDFGTKADNSPPPGGQLSAAEFNNLATENENSVLRSGQSLNGGSTTQLAVSLFIHGTKSLSFQDNGVANAYVATPTSGASGVLLPSSYAPLNGAVMMLKPAFTNTGASTLDIGQTTGTLIGAKPIRGAGDTALPAGVISAGRYTQLIYNAAFDSGNGAWEVLPWGSAGGTLINTQSFFASGTYTPTPGMTTCYARVLGGGGGGGGAPITAAGNVGLGAGGHAGAYAEGRFTAAQIGASKVVTVGIGGAGSTGTGGTGGTTSLGALIIANGGIGGGSAGNAAPPISNGNGGNPATSSGGYLNAVGQIAPIGVAISTAVGYAGAGAPSAYGSGGGAPNSTSNGTNGQGFGTGGSGAYAGSSNASVRTGGNGTAGFVIVLEYA